MEGTYSRVYIHRFCTGLVGVVCSWVLTVVVGGCKQVLLPAVGDLRERQNAMTVSPIAIPADARLIDPATDRDREVWLDFRAVTLSEVSLVTHTIRRRLTAGAAPEAVFTSGRKAGAR